eukprot:scaffold287_cov151-Skeletonema_marinoi.AAC.2
MAIRRVEYVMVSKTQERYWRKVIICTLSHLFPSDLHRVRGVGIGDVSSEKVAVALGLARVGDT